MRIALVHDWLTGMRGGEKCLEVLCRLWPDADLFTLLHARGRLSPAIERMRIHTSFLQRLPGIERHYRYALPLMPTAIESFDLTGYDLVVSLSHCVAKSVRVPPGVPQVCYCFTPMRYAWHMREAYATECGGRSAEGQNLARRWISTAARTPLSALRSILLADLRRWDRATSNRVTQFVAISETVRRRIRDCYGRESDLIYPPVDTDFYTPAAVPREDFYLCVSALVPYKQLDLAIDSCNRLGRRLVVIGAGPEDARLRTVAGPTVSLLGWQPDEVIRDHYRRCRALVFPGVEDFGIVPLEAQACGAPVIALAEGGATETVVPPRAGRPGTGLWFDDQSAAALSEAILKFEASPTGVCSRLARGNAERFGVARFADAIRECVQSVIGAAAIDVNSKPVRAAA